MSEKVETIIAKVDERTLCVWLSVKILMADSIKVHYSAFVYAQPVAGGDTVVLAREHSAQPIDAAGMLDHALEMLRAAGAEIHGPDHLIPWLRAEELAQG